MVNQNEEKENQMTDDSDLISIILPTYNRSGTIEKAICSVINQTYENWELIIVDDASTDNTREIVEKYTDIDERIVYIQKQENKGANYCRNIGVKSSIGKYIAFLDSDNFWERKKLEIQFKVIKESGEEVAFVFCDEVISNGIVEALFPDRNYIECDIGEALLIKNIVDTNTALVKRRCFERVGGFDENMPRLQDWELFFRIINVFGYKAIYIPQCLNNNIIQKDSITKNSKKYVDAIFALLGKYPQLFSNIDLIMMHILDAFTYGTGEEVYISQKIYEVYSKSPDIMQGILLNMGDIHRKLQRQYRFYALLYEWKLKNSKMKETSLFSKIFIQKDMAIAIYGLGKWGELFYQDIKNLPVKILYGIDEKAEDFHSIRIKRPDERLEKVDLIVVTVFQEFKAIKTELEKKYTGKIVSIEDLIKQV